MDASHSLLKKGLSLAAAATIVACLELLWNLAVARTPIYWLPAYHPLFALLLNALLHILITIATLLLIGLPVACLIGRSRPNFPVLLAASLFFAFYMGWTLIFRLVDMRDLPRKTAVLLSWSWLGMVALCGGIGWVVIRRIRQSGKSPAWPATIIMSILVASVAVVLRWFAWPMVNLCLAIAVLIILHAGLFLLTRRWRPNLLTVSVVCLIGAIGILFFRGIWAISSRASSRPNLVLMVWDAMRADRLSVYGYDKVRSPAAELLAAHAVVFNRAYSTANYTYPSHVSIFTGLYNQEHNLWFGTNAEKAAYGQKETIAEALSGKGYRTAFVSENLWLSGLLKGFQIYSYVEKAKVDVTNKRGPGFDISKRRGVLTPEEAWFSANCPSPFFLRQLIDQIRYQLEGNYKTVIDDYQLRMIQEQLILKRRNQPIFIFINWMNVHDRYYPDLKFDNDLAIYPYHWEEEYDAAVAYLDRRLKSLIAVFRNSGELERSIFVLTSDHGSMMDEQGLGVGHGASLFDPVLHVPLIFYCSLCPAPRVIDTPVTLVGLKSSLELIAEANSSDNRLIDQLVTNMTEGREVVASNRSENPGPDGQFQWSAAFLSKNLLKLMHDPTLQKWGTPWGATADFLFDLSADPKESENLYQAKPELRQAIIEKYRHWEQKVGKASSVAEGKYPPRLKEWLRTLGYVQ